MSTSALIIRESTGLDEIIGLVTNSVNSPNSRRAYKRALTSFLDWYEGQARPGMTKATINAYRNHLVEQGLKPASVNQALSAVRKLAAEAADNGHLDPAAAASIGRVKGISQKGQRVGNWLTKDQAQRLILTPDTSSLKGKRDRAILAVMIGAGLRRSEAAGLTFGHIQQREGRWVILDLVGKGGRIRTAPLPAWAKVAIDEWAAAANLLYVGRVFRPVNRHGKIDGDHLTDQAIYYVVAEHSQAAGLDVAAHDLRRTFAKLAHKGGAALEQIQLTLGHASIQTTERYLGVEQNLTQAPCDVLGISIR